MLISMWHWTSNAGSSARTVDAFDAFVMISVVSLSSVPPSCTSSLPFVLLFALWFLGHCASLPIWQH